MASIIPSKDYQLTNCGMNGSENKLSTLASNMQGSNAMSLVELLVGAQCKDMKQDPYSPIPLDDVDSALANMIGSGCLSNDPAEFNINGGDYKKHQEEEKVKLDDIPKPKRPLNAYNLFFRHERARLLMEADSGKTPNLSHKEPENGKDHVNVKREERPKLQRDEVLFLLENSPYKHDATRKRPHRKTHGKVGFSDLARHIAQTWKSTDSETRALFTELAEEDKQRYRREFELYKVRKMKLQKKQMESDTSGPDEVYSSSSEQQQQQQFEASLQSQPLCTPSSMEGRPHKRWRTNNGASSFSQNPGNLFNVLDSVLDIMGDDTQNQINGQAQTLASIYNDANLLSRTSQICQLGGAPAFASIPREDLMVFAEALNTPISCLSNLPAPISSAGTPENTDLKDFLSELDWSKLEKDRGVDI